MRGSRGSAPPSGHHGGSSSSSLRGRPGPPRPVHITEDSQPNENRPMYRYTSGRQPPMIRPTVAPRARSPAVQALPSRPPLSLVSGSDSSSRSSTQPLFSSSQKHIRYTKGALGRQIQDPRKSTSLPEDTVSTDDDEDERQAVISVLQEKPLSRIAALRLGAPVVSSADARRLERFNQTCQWWLSGTCSKGDRCLYRHANPPSASSDRASVTTQIATSHQSTSYKGEAPFRRSTSSPTPVPLSISETLPESSKQVPRVDEHIGFAFNPPLVASSEDLAVELEEFTGDPHQVLGGGPQPADNDSRVQQMESFDERHAPDRATSQLSQARSSLTEQETIVKTESRSPTPSPSGLPRPSRKTIFIPMQPKYVLRPGNLDRVTERRKAWVREEKHKIQAEGYQVIKTIIRADGMALECVKDNNLLKDHSYMSVESGLEQQSSSTPAESLESNSSYISPSMQSEPPTVYGHPSSTLPFQDASFGPVAVPEKFFQHGRSASAVPNNFPDIVSESFVLETEFGRPSQSGSRDTGFHHSGSTASQSLDQTSSAPHIPDPVVKQEPQDPDLRNPQSFYSANATSALSDSRDSFEPPRLASSNVLKRTWDQANVRSSSAAHEAAHVLQGAVEARLPSMLDPPPHHITGNDLQKRRRVAGPPNGVSASYFAPDYNGSTEVSSSHSVARHTTSASASRSVLSSNTLQEEIPHVLDISPSVSVERATADWGTAPNHIPFAIAPGFQSIGPSLQRHPINSPSHPVSLPIVQPTHLSQLDLMDIQGRGRAQIERFQSGQLSRVNPDVVALASQIQWFLPEAATTSRVVSLHFLTVENGRTSCILHRDDATAKTFAVEGKPRLDCGCDEESVLMEWIWWKTWKASDGPNSVQPEWLSPRMRYFFTQMLKDQGRLALEDFWGSELVRLENQLGRTHSALLRARSGHAWYEHKMYNSLSYGL